MPERMMITEDAADMVAEAAEEVLETMFFTMVVDPEEVPEPGEEPCSGARVRFEGAPSGALELSLDRPAAVSIAATFLSIDEEESLTAEQVDGVVGELANMVCGAALSRLESEATFNLASPEVIAEALPDEDGGAVCCRLPLECGWIRLRLTTGE